MDSIFDSTYHLKDYQFEEVLPPRHRRGNRFTVWFRAGERSVVIEGEGWGTMVRVHLEHDSGVRIAEIYLVPLEARPIRTKRKPVARGQLEEIRLGAERVRQHTTDFLTGDLKRFLDLAAPLPSYLQEKR